ncbi:MAG: hypothetical protein LBP67_10180 [Bacteroidales bacterium]|jgi:hypothetical protein|nr:hypothetical protein [Bacteroidales bacterium]
MKNLLKTQSLLFILLAILFTSCVETYSEDSYYIDNKSNSVLYVQFQDKYGGNEWELITIPKNSYTRIYAYGYIGEMHDKLDDFLTHYFDHLHITLDSRGEIKIKKDYTSSNNWEYDPVPSNKRKNLGINNYIFTVNDDDLE